MRGRLLIAACVVGAIAFYGMTAVWHLLHVDQRSFPRVASPERVRARARPVAAAAAEISPASTGAQPSTLDWREALRRSRAARCASATAGPVPGCERLSASGAKPKLTRALVEAHADESRTIFVAFTNYDYMDFARSWVSNLVREGVTSLLVGAMDEAALLALDGLDAPCFMMSTPDALVGRTDLQGSSQGQTEYLKLGSFKTALVAQIIGYGVDVVLSDTDNIIMRDPRPFFARFPRADVLSTADLLATTSTDGGLERRVPEGTALNVGLMLLRTTSAPLLLEWAEHMAKHPMHWDQAIFNDFVKRGWAPLGKGREQTRDNGQLVRCYGGTLWCGVLPVSLFCGGHHFHAEHLPHKLGLRPYALHTTFINSGTQGKRHRLREAMVFEDPPEYYDPPQGVLSFAIDVPSSLYTPRRFSLTQPSGKPQFTLEEHFALINHQLAQIRDALALANATGRLLVLPPLVCGLDRYFYRHDGVSPGSAVHLPLWDCPADMVLALQLGIKTPERWLREAPFLSNPRTPPSIADPARGAELSLEPAVLGVAPEGDRGLRHSAALRDAVLGALRAPAVASARAVRLVGRLPDAQAWMGESEYLAFEAFVRPWGDFWCCGPLEGSMPPDQLKRVNANHELGLKTKTHIYYDMFWDKVPHTDRLGRTWRSKWRPIYGEKWNVTDAMTDPWRSMVVFGVDPREASARH